MAITPSDIVQITRTTAGPASTASQAAQIFAVVGTAATGDTNKPRITTTDRDPTAWHTAGPLVETAEIIASYSGQPVVAVRAVTATPGTYGAIGLTGFLGTASITASATAPYLDGEVYVKFKTGGDLGVAADGITYEVSPDGGRSWLAAPAGNTTTFSLGAATSITVAPLNATFQLAPPVLFTLVNEIVDEYLAHIADAVSHNPADTANTVSTAAVTTMAEVYAKAIAYKTAAQAHANNTGGTYHDSADATFAAAIAALTTPTTPALAVTFWNSAKAAYNAHRTAVGVHPANDVTNVVSTDEAEAGTIEDGDVFTCRTVAPAFDSAGLAAALDALRAWRGSAFGGLVVVGEFDPAALWATLVTGLDAMRADQLPLGVVLLEARAPESETPTEYRLAIIEEWAGYTREAVYPCAGKRGRFDPTTLRRATYQYERLQTAPAAARLAALDYRQSPGLTASQQDSGVTSGGAVRGTATAFGGPLAGYRIYDTSGNLFGHDEAADPGLGAAGFGVCTSHRHAQAGPTAAYVWLPNTRAETGNRAPHIAQQRVVAVIEATIYRVGTAAIQGKLLYDPNRNTIRPDLAAVLEGMFLSAIYKEVGDPSSPASGVSNVTIAVDKAAIIDPAEPIVAVYGEIVTAFYTAGFRVNLRVNQ